MSNPMAQFLCAEKPKKSAIEVHPQQRTLYKQIDCRWIASHVYWAYVYVYTVYVMCMCAVIRDIKIIRMWDLHLFYPFHSFSILFYPLFLRGILATYHSSWPFQASPALQRSPPASDSAAQSPRWNAHRGCAAGCPPAHTAGSCT